MSKALIQKALKKVGVEHPRETFRLFLTQKLLRKSYHWTEFPPVIQIDISNYCGKKYCGILCEYCFPQYQIARGAEEYAEMPMEWIKWIFENISRHQKSMWFYSIFLNGDGLTDLRTPEILKLGKQYAPNLPTQTFTSGVRTKNADLLIDPNLDWICFTLSAHNRELYKKVHRGDHFEDVMTTMRYVTRNRLPHQKLEVHFVITEQNFPYMKNWLNMVETEYPDWVPVFSPLVETDSNLPSKKALGDLTLKEQEDAIQKVAGDKYKFWRTTTTALRQPCVLWNNCSIHVSGAILQCCNWADPKMWNYGYVQEYVDEGRTLQEYWIERLANRMRNPLCRGCNLKHPNFKRRLDGIKIKGSVKI